MKPRPESFHYAYVIAFFSIFVVTGAIGLGRFSFTMIYPGMMTGLGVGNTEMGLIASANFVGYLIFALAGGILASKYSPRIVISVSLLVAGLSMLATGLVQGMASAMVWRFITGLGSGGSNVPVMGLLSTWFGPKRRGMATGFAVGGSGVGIAIAGFVVPMINRLHPEDSWRYNWFYLGAAVMVIGLLGYLLLRNSPREMGLAPVGASPSPLQKQANPEVAPVGISHIYRDREIWRLALLYFLFGFSYIIMVNFFSAYLIREVGLTDAEAGYLWSIVGIMGIFCGVFWGIISDYIGRPWSLTLVFILHGLSYFLFAWGHDPFYYWSATIIFSFTSFAPPAIIAAATGDIVGSRNAPAGLGIITACLGLGQTMAPALVGFLTDMTGTYRWGFFLASFIAIISAMGARTIKDARKHS